MKQLFFGMLVLITMCGSFVAGAQNTDEEAKEEIAKHRAKQESEFRDPEKSPLGKKGAKKFKGLNYYPVDLKYRVTAKFIPNEKPELFKMKTSTARLPEYSKYGDLVFTIDGVELKLEVYESPAISGNPEYANYLFVPFTDLTNGEETYHVGRYLDLKKPLSEEVILDFNLSYNPYCSYSPNYSCPIPPAANQLSIAIPAGEKMYEKH